MFNMADSASSEKISIGRKVQQVANQYTAYLDEAHVLVLLRIQGNNAKVQDNSAYCAYKDNSDKNKDKTIRPNILESAIIQNCYNQIKNG